MRHALKTVCATLCLTGSALAQSASPTVAGAPARPALPPNAAAATGPTLNERMAANGGSLLRATMEADPQPGQASLRDVSFYAVPEPEPKVLKKHDLVTVIVREESAFKSDGNTDLKRENSLDAKLAAFVKLKLSNFEIQGIPSPTNPPEVTATGDREFKASGEVDRTDSMTARIAVEIVDVKPNGTIVLQGSKRIKTDDEEQQFILTGTCRAGDVTADNSVLSSNLYDLVLEKKHKGAVRDATKRGWGGQIIGHAQSVLTMKLSDEGLNEPSNRCAA